MHMQKEPIFYNKPTTNIHLGTQSLYNIYLAVYSICTTPNFTVRVNPQKYYFYAKITVKHPLFTDRNIL
jgi:hypothetical protein